MSRIGKKPIDLPAKVKLSVTPAGAVTVEGPKGTLGYTLPREIKASVQENRVLIERGNETREVRALHGLARSLVNNMITGVATGFVKDLEIHGVGFKSNVQGRF